jgi:biopolymer transport protein ExbB
MNSLPIVLAQLTNNDQGWLTRKLLGVTLGSAEWVLWLLAVLSILSIAVMLERLLFFSSHRLADSDALGMRLARGEFDAVKASVSSQKGMEAAVVREAIAAAAKGPDAVEEIIAATVAREKPQYERFMSFLGTLGSNAPFIGLFGTVLGIIKAFHDLGQTGAKGSAIQQTVMAGISEALVATAVGLAVAIPAVVGYNALTRQLKNLTARTTALGHAVVGHLRTVSPSDRKAA